MPTLSEVKAFREKMYCDSMALIEQKGHDYSRAQQMSGDTLFNLKVAEILGIVPTAERGILVRLSDKFMRLISLMTPGVDPANAGESVRDTVRDIHNYVDYALQLWEDRNTDAGGECCQIHGCEHAPSLSSVGTLSADVLQRGLDVVLERSAGDPVQAWYTDMNADVETLA